MTSTQVLVKSAERFAYPTAAADVLRHAGRIAAAALDEGEARVGAWTDLQGGSGESLAREQLPYWARDLDIRDAERPQVVELFDRLNLPELTQVSVRAMLKDDRQELADRLVGLVEGTYHPQVLMAAGVDYARFGFASEREAFAYGERLQALYEAIRKRPFYGALQQLTTVEHALHIRANDRSKGRQLFVVYDTESAKLRTHSECTR